MCYEELESLFLIICIHVLLFMLFPILSISCQVIISFLYSSAIIVFNIYMSYCSNIDLS